MYSTWSTSSGHSKSYQRSDTFQRSPVILRYCLIAADVAAKEHTAEVQLVFGPCHTKTWNSAPGSCSWIYLQSITSSDCFVIEKSFFFFFFKWLAVQTFLIEMLMKLTIPDYSLLV